MTMADWQMLQAFHAVEPFGPRQEDYRAAVAGILPSSAMDGRRRDPGTLFASLAGAGAVGDRKTMGRSFRLFAVANCPALAAVAADRTRAE